MQIEELYWILFILDITKHVDSMAPLMFSALRFSPKPFLHVQFISSVPQRTHAHLPGGDWDRMILGYKPRNVTSLSFEVCCMRGEDAHFCRVSAGLCCVLYSWTSSCFLPPCVTASPPSVLRTPDTYRNCFNPISRNELS